MLTPAARQALLLCAPGPGVTPLRPKEFETLCVWQQKHGLPLEELPTAPDLPVDGNRLAALLAREAMLRPRVARWHSKGIRVVGRQDEDFPHRLLAGRTPLLYMAGPRQEGPALAIVGSRAAQNDALHYTHEVAACCAGQGVRVISGGARGVDAAAMHGALRAGGQVMGVLAGGLWRAVQRHAAAIAAGQLVLLSPYDPDVGFSPGNATGRNPLIYALGGCGPGDCIRPG